MANALLTVSFSNADIISSIDTGYLDISVPEGEQIIVTSTDALFASIAIKTAYAGAVGTILLFPDTTINKALNLPTNLSWSKTTGEIIEVSEYGGWNATFMYALYK